MAKSTKQTYSVEEVKKIMDKYVQASSKRLAARLKLAWKRRASQPISAYGKVTV